MNACPWLAASVLLLAASCTKERPAAPSDAAATPSARDESDGAGSASATAGTSAPSDGAKPTPASAADFRYVAMKKGAFPNAAGDEHTRVVSRIDYPSDAKATFAEELIAKGFRRALTAEEAKELELGAPSEVWLFGGDGPCRAELGKPYAAAYDDPTLVLEVGFYVQPCTDAPAPVAFVGAAPPSAKWVDATTDTADEVSKPSEWKHPLRSVLVARGFGDWKSADGPKTGPKFHVRIRSAGPVSELAWAHHWPGDDCEEHEDIDLAIGVVDGEAFTPFAPPSDYASDAELVGTLTLDDRAWVVIADHRFQLQLGWVDGKSIDWTELDTGNYHDEVTAYWGWSVLEGYCGP